MAPAVARAPRGGLVPNRKTKEKIMKAFKNVVAKLVRDEQGGEVLEYALIAGLIVVAAIAVIGSVGTKVLARWNSLNASM
jgi:Flp pilus assembly pilin Flp